MVLMIVVFMIHAWLVLPNLIRKKQWKEILVISVLSLVGVLVSGLLIINPDPPKIGAAIGRIVHSIFQSKRI